MALKSRPFLESAARVLAERIENRAQVRVRPSMLQVWFDDPRQHYEIWLRPNAGLIELGLHFEGVREDNLRRIAAVADAMPLVLGALGPAVEVEEWTESWTRVHESVPLLPLDEAFALELGNRLAAYVEALEPIVRPLGPMLAAEPRAAASRRRWGAGRSRARRPQAT